MMLPSHPLRQLTLKGVCDTSKRRLNPPKALQGRIQFSRAAFDALHLIG
jgi:hypothetical protein